jgi:hypothetical protein
MHMDDAMCCNGHQVVDEFRRLKILRASHPRYSPDISPCDFWMSGYFKRKLKDRSLQDPEEILTAFQELWDNIIFEKFQMVFESGSDWLRWIIEHRRAHFRQ